MVKHAADEQQPLLTAAERVERAMTRITAGQQFTDEQRQWVERIHAHLAQNLSITADDFHIVPVFTREGGWRRADRVFGGELEGLLGKINEAIAA
jgi:type I restriction enzyme R subunit